MSKAAILSKMKQAMLELDGASIDRLIKEGLDAGIEPMEIIIEGLSPALTEIGAGFEKNERFMSDLVIAGEMMNDAMVTLRPAMEKGGKFKGEVMVIGTVEGDQHNIGKRIVSALFVGGGYKVIDIGENQPASEFVKAVKENKPTLVGASAILSPLKPQCKVINDALKDAGLRDKVIFIIGGWNMNQPMCDSFGADAFATSGVEAVNKVHALKSGEMKKFKDRKK